MLDPANGVAAHPESAGVSPRYTGASALVRKLWQYCNVLRDDGLSYPDYVEQLTYLLFLKLSDEMEDGPVPIEYSWASFAGLDAHGMYQHYGSVLQALGQSDGMLGRIFSNAKNKIRDPGKLRLLITDLIGQTEWLGLSQDVKGDAYEGLLEKNARDTKSGAGQYFTPRALIDAIIECVNPRYGESVCDPACGTGGFLLSAHECMRRDALVPNGDPTVAPGGTMRGVELVEEVARLATMNVLLHQICDIGESEVPIVCGDSLKMPSPEHFDIVVTNPPFGTRGSVRYARNIRGEKATFELTIVRPDFWVDTANKQLNFLQHVYTLLKPGGRAAVVVPDNVLFEAGVAATVRRRLLDSCNVHTLLRLPAGLFYASGVKANVLFFERLRAADLPRNWGSLAVYDMRSTKRFSLKTNPMVRADLQEFVGLYRERRSMLGSKPAGDEGSPRWRMFEQRVIVDSEECSLDIDWQGHAMGPREAGMARLEELSELIAEDLGRALEHVQAATAAEKPRE